MNWSCKLTLWQRERDGGGGQPQVKSEVSEQSNTVGRLWFFWGGDAREYPGGRLRLDSAFAYAEAPSSWTLSRLEGLPGSRHMISACSVKYSCLENSMDKGAVWATVHGVAKSRIRLSDWGLYHSDKKLKELLWERDKSKRKDQISRISKGNGPVGLLCRENPTWQVPSICRDFQSSF